MMPRSGRIDAWQLRTHSPKLTPEPMPPFGAKPPSGADWIHEIKHDVVFASWLVPAD
jgi:hypothetical protein